MNKKQAGTGTYSSVYVYLVLCMSVACNNIILYLPVSIHLLCQSIGTGSSTFGFLLTKSHWELCNMNFRIRSSISKILTAEYNMMYSMCATAYNTHCNTSTNISPENSTTYTKLRT